MQYVKASGIDHWLTPLYEYWMWCCIIKTQGPKVPLSAFSPPKKLTLRERKEFHLHSFLIPFFVPFVFFLLLFFVPYCLLTFISFFLPPSLLFHSFCPLLLLFFVPFHLLTFYFILFHLKRMYRLKYYKWILVKKCKEVFWKIKKWWWEKKLLN